MAAKISLEDLTKSLQLSHEQLDASVSDEHLSKVSRIIDNYENLGPELGLTPDEMTEIGSEQLEKGVVLRKWKQVSAWKATYRKLIEALLKCSRADLAQKVGVLLVESTSEKPSSSSCHSAGVPASCLSPRVEQPQGQIVDAPAVSQPDLDKAEDTTQLRQEANYLEKKFEDLLNAASDDLERMEVPLRKIRRSLYVRRATDTETDTDLIANQRHEIREANTVDELFDILSCARCWDFLNPGLLKRIIEDHCSESVDAQKVEYLEKLQHFRKTTSAQQFAKVCRISSLSPHFSEVVFEMGSDWNNATLEDVENLKQKVLGQGYLSGHMFNFRRSKN